MNKIRLLLVSALMLAAFVMTANPALAVTCEYGGRTGNDGGPCMQFSGSFAGFDLWCLQGYTSPTHKIIMYSGDSFTCKVLTTDSPVAKTWFGQKWTEHYWRCDTSPDLKIKQKNKMAGASLDSLRWEYTCER